VTRTSQLWQLGGGVVGTCRRCYAPPGYASQVKTLSSQEVVFAIERGVPIIDVRPADLYAKVRMGTCAHMKMKQHAPIYACLGCR
jgi:hypothetical protein